MSPVEVVDLVNHFAGIDVHQQHVVVVAHPAVGTRGWGQAVIARIADPVVLAKERLVEEESDAKLAVGIATVRGIVPAAAEDVAVLVAITLPVVALVTAPAVVPDLSLAVVVLVPIAAILVALVLALILAAAIAFAPVATVSAVALTIDIALAATLVLATLPIAPIMVMSLRVVCLRVAPIMVVSLRVVSLRRYILRRLDLPLIAPLPTASRLRNGLG